MGICGEVGKWVDSEEFGWVEGNLFHCRLKFWRQAAKTFTSDEQSSLIFREFHNFTAMESEQEVFKNYGVRFAKERKNR